MGREVDQVGTRVGEEGVSSRRQESEEEDSQDERKVEGETSGE
jgi:hypothetical protein